MNIADASDDISRGHSFIKSSKLAKGQPWGTSVEQLSNTVTSVELLALNKLAFFFTSQLHGLLDIF